MNETTDFDYAAYFAKQRAELVAKMGPKKAAILAAAKAMLIDDIEFTYNGEGDEGQIDEINATRSDEGHPLPTAVDITTGQSDGFEINDGGFGTITIDVATTKVSLNRHDNFVDSTSMDVEV